MSSSFENGDNFQPKHVATRQVENSDGNIFESDDSVLNALRSSNDLSLGSEELQKHITDWNSLYQLSSKRADLLRPFTEELRNKKLLQIGCDCGAITRFLGELNCSVLVLEENQGRALAAAERCRDLEKIKIVRGTIETLFTDEKFDLVLLIGLPAANHQTGGRHHIVTIIEKIKPFLNAAGRLLLALENRIGLKYWAGAPEESASTSYRGIQGLTTNEDAKTFGYHETVSLLEQAGFEISESMFPFPDYKFADIVVTEAGFQNENFDAAGLLFEKFEYLQDKKYNNQYSSTLVARSLFQNNLLSALANSFIISATRGNMKTPVATNPVLAYVYSTSRKKQYCKETVFIYQANDESVWVNRRHLYPNHADESSSVRQLLCDEPYIRGEVLWNTILPILSVSGWRLSDIIKWARTYYDIVIGRSLSKDGSISLDGKYVDLTPFNIILSHDGPKFFDLEWVSGDSVPAYYVFFRGLAHGLARILFVDQPADGTPLQISEIASEVTRHYFEFGEAELQDCQRREKQYFSAVAINEMTEPFPPHPLNIRNSEHLETLRLNKKLFSQNKELSLQVATLLNELQEKEQQLALEISLYNSARKKEIQLTKDIQSLKKDIQWYVTTYENRSLAGVIRQKLSGGQWRLFRRLKQSWDYAMIPAHDIGFNKQRNEYATIGIDPYFNIDVRNENLDAGWYWLNLEINAVAGKLLSPKLYFNAGLGFNETDICYLPPPKEGRIVALINFHEKVFELRFDPSVNDCRFTIGKFSLQKISKLQALSKTISLYKQTFPRKSSRLILQQLLLKYRKHGRAGLREELRKMAQANVTTRITPYMEWCNRYDTLLPFEPELLRAYSLDLKRQPLFSIIMPVYNPPLVYLQKAIDSVIKQSYANWELCIADDCSTDKRIKKLLADYQASDNRIKVIYRQKNGHISEASNTALEISTGEFIILLDQDDQLNDYTLYVVAETISNNPHAALLYSDEDKIDEEDNRFDPYFKTDWNPDLFMGQNMISHLGVYKRSIVREIGGFRKGFEGSQDYDLALRFIAKINPSQIVHIPHILYHWRAITGSTALTIDNKGYALDAGLRALNDFLQDQHLDAEALPNKNASYRVKWNLSNKPRTSIVIPTKDKAQVLSVCIESILQKTKYADYEIIIVDNNSEDQATFDLYSYLSKKDPRITIVPYNHPFNFSAIVNFGVSKASGEVLVILNNDTEVINEDWLDELVAQALRTNVGAVGAKLLYPNGSIQHAGVILYENHPGIHIYQGKRENDPGYFNKLNLVQNYSAVTAACLAIRKQLFEEIGGLDEKNLPIAYNDVDFCLKLREKGFYNVWTPFSMLYHHESLSRGDDFDETNIERFKKEHAYMLRKWQKFINNDTYFNPNLSPETRTVNYANPPKIVFSWRKKEFYDEQHFNLMDKHETLT